MVINNQLACCCSLCCWLLLSADALCRSRGGPQDEKGNAGYPANYYFAYICDANFQQTHKKPRVFGTIVCRASRIAHRASRIASAHRHVGAGMGSLDSGASMRAFRGPARVFCVPLWSLLLLSTLIRGDGEYWGRSDDDPALREG